MQNNSNQKRGIVIAASIFTFKISSHVSRTVFFIYVLYYDFMDDACIILVLFMHNSLVRLLLFLFAFSPPEKDFHTANTRISVSSNQQGRCRKHSVVPYSIAGTNHTFGKDICVDVLLI